jgi:uncharacterized membrane protein YccF (DUF307 family)
LLVLLEMQDPRPAQPEGGAQEGMRENIAMKRHRVIAIIYWLLALGTVIPASWIFTGVLSNHTLTGVPVALCLAFAAAELAHQGLDQFEKYRKACGNKSPKATRF